MFKESHSNIDISGISSSLSNTSKFEGLLETSFTKKARNIIFQLITFFDYTVPNFQSVYSVITIFRLLQLYGPSLATSFSSIYKQSSEFSITAGILSIPFLLVPSFSRENVLVPFLYTSNVLCLLTCLTLCISAYTYHKSAKLNHYICCTLSLLIDTFAQIIQPINAHFTGETIALMISGKYASNLAFPIWACIISITQYFLYLYFQRNILTITIIFRHEPLANVQGSKQCLITFIICLVNFLMGLSSHLSKVPSIVIMVITIAVYAYNIVRMNTGAGLYRKLDAHFNLTHSFSGIVNLLVVIIFRIIDKEGNILIIGIFAIIYFSSYIATCFLSRNVMLSNIHLLDVIQENNETLQLIKSVNRFLAMALDGFLNNHPLCTSFDIFMLGLKQYGTDVNVLLVFTKFIAIYPDGSKILDFIENKLTHLEVKDFRARQTIHQIHVINNSRQNILSFSLKKKLNTITKKERSTKRKMLTILDAVIQGNLSELDTAVEIAYHSTSQLELELLRLKADYPNNSFVARSYARYLRDVQADFTKAREEHEKITKLRRGITSVPDKCYELGMNAFPRLPRILTMPIVSPTSRESGIDEVVQESATIEDEVDDDDIEAIEAIRRHALEVRIPSIRCSLIGSLTTFVVLCFIPQILLVSINDVYSTEILKPVDLMHSISACRRINFQMTGFMTRIAAEELQLNGSNIGSESEYYLDYFPASLGGTRNTREQLQVVTEYLSSTMQGIESIRNFQNGNKYIDKVRDLLFSKPINYTFYTSPNNFSYREFSSQYAVMNTKLASARVLNSEMNISILSSSEYLNPVHNIVQVGEYLSEALSEFVNYVKDLDNFYQKLFLIIEIVVSILSAIICFFFQGYTFHATHSDLVEVFKCLIGLPKGVVSASADKLRVIKRDSTSERETQIEMNKQEESIIKIFMSAADTSSAQSGMIDAIITAAYIVLVASTIAGIVIGCNWYKQQSKDMMQRVPHIDFVCGTAAYLYGGITTINSIAISEAGIPVVFPKPRELIDQFEYYFKQMSEFFDKCRFGEKNGSGYPYFGFPAANEKADDIIQCDDDTAVPTSVASYYACTDGEYRVYLYKALVAHMIDEYKVVTGYQILPSHEIFNKIWMLGPIVSYDTLLSPMIEELKQVVHQAVESQSNKTIVEIVVIIIVSVVCLVVILMQILEKEKRIRYTLSLLVHFNPKVVMSTPKIMQVFSGNFKKNDVEGGLRTTKFFEDVVSKMIDSVIIVDENKRIKSMNAVAQNTFGVDSSDYIDTDFSKFFTGSRFVGDLFPILSTSPLQNSDADHQNQARSIILNYEDMVFEVSVNPIKGSIIITLKDDTARANYQKLISEERIKSDQMLSSILPKALVPRVQAGESNISFAVQSATILFLDIVSFTPWCGANQAAYIMKVLNRLFKDLDSKLQTFPTMTKIKCIGDCYMAAGGIFAEVNQPNVHAREVVAFGLEAIKVVENIDKELNEKLQIRVGVNSGGPLVAGVIGTAKPTFEIIGPVINMAQQMEHHGVPMAVHISRSTYELIYGSNFKIKERGEIEIKNGKAETYIVTE